MHNIKVSLQMKAIDGTDDIQQSIILYKFTFSGVEMSVPRNLNMLTCTGDLAMGLKIKQSLLAPDSPRPLGVTIRRGREPFCSSSHISATDSL
jgi:hypothetical protein